MKKPSYTLLSVLAADLLAASGDISATWTSPMYPKLYSNDSSINPIGRPITAVEDSWIGSIVNISSVIGAIPACYLADKIGRKWALLILAIPHITAFLTFAFANKVYLFLAARFWSGLAVGAGYALLPIYLAEISEDSNRGAMCVTLNVFWSFGNFLPPAIGPYVSIRNFNLILAVIPTAFFVIFLLLAPESPEYLVHKGDIIEAKKVLKILRPLKNEKEIQKEIDEIKDTKKEDGSLKDLFQDRALFFGFYVSLVIIVIMQLSGLAAINNYTQMILDESDIGLTSDVSSTFCGVWNFLTGFITIFIVERLGRKPPLVFSLVGCGVTNAILGVFFYMKTHNADLTYVSWIPLFSLLGYIFVFNAGLAAIPWTFSSEIFPNNVKSVTGASASAVSCISAYLVAQFFNDLNDALGPAWTWMLFAGSCIFGALFCLIFMPETKGMSYNEIYAVLQKKTAENKLFLK